MNERYYKLANEAWCSVNQRIGFNDAQRRELFEREFAELIVRECASLTLDPMQIDEAQYYHGWLDYRDVILKHFGVK
jgi:hypothetical protein